MTQLRKTATERARLLAAFGDHNGAGMAPLAFSALSGSMATCDALLDKGARIADADKKGVTALHCAAENDHAGVCNGLIARGADIGSLSLGLDTPLHTAAHFAGVNACIALASQGAKLLCKNAHGFTPVDLASKHKRCADFFRALQASQEATRAVDQTLASAKRSPQQQ